MYLIYEKCFSPAWRAFYCVSIIVSFLQNHTVVSALSDSSYTSYYWIVSLGHLICGRWTRPTWAPCCASAGWRRSRSLWLWCVSPAACGCCAAGQWSCPRPGSHTQSETAWWRTSWLYIPARNKETHLVVNTCDVAAAAWSWEEKFEEYKMCWITSAACWPPSGSTRPTWCCKRSLCLWRSCLVCSTSPT